MKSIALVFIFCAFAAGAWATTAIIAEDGMLEVDGQRTFVLGLYENPDDARLDEAAAAGFNLIHASADAAALDRLWTQKIYAWLNTGYTIDLGTDTETRKAELERMAGEFAKHPGFLVWEVPDEALWNTWYSATQWRRGAEPRKQNALIVELQDADLASELRGMRDEAEAAYGRGEPRIGEQLADEIWKKLGKEPPNPDLNLSNAPERQVRLAEGMVQGYQLLKNLDPNHPIWMNHAPRNSIEQLALFNRGADAVGCDIYPVPRERDNGHSDLSDQFLSCVGGYTRRMQEAAPGKPVWMVLQGFAWADLRETADVETRDLLRKPRPDESRFMAYDAIVNGARGILYWGTAYVDKDEPFWTELLSLVAELSAQQFVLSAPDAALDIDITLAETWGSLDRGVRVLPKQVDGRVYLLVVNEWLDPLVYTLHGLDSLEGTRYRDRETGQESMVEHGALTLPIGAFGVHVLEPLKP
jgi:hypothetical protein